MIERIPTHVSYEVDDETYEVPASAFPGAALDIHRRAINKLIEEVTALKVEVSKLRRLVLLVRPEIDDIGTEWEETIGDWKLEDMVGPEIEKNPVYGWPNSEGPPEQK